jgi:hypothetical protein
MGRKSFESDAVGSAELYVRSGKFRVSGFVRVHAL